jgi:type VI secretion system protein ImpA
MPKPPLLNVDDFLQPISSENPVGEYLKYEREYDEIEEHRRADEDSKNRGVWDRKIKKAQWDEVFNKGTELLKHRSKDLQIAAWVVEALAHLDGFVGLRDGLKLFRALQDAFWKTAHPNSGDLQDRDGTYEFLDNGKRLPLIIRNQPLTQVQGLESYSYLKYQESLNVENIIRRESDSERAAALREKLEKEEGKIGTKRFEDAVDLTKREFYEELSEVLGECREALEQLDASTRAEDHYSLKGHRLSATGAALQDVTKLVGQFLSKKPAAKKPQTEPESDNQDSATSTSDSSPEAEEQPAGVSTGSSGTEPRASTARARSGAIAGPDDARERIADAARYLREADPADPTPYLVLRAQRMGELYRLSSPVGSAVLPAPTTVDRQALRRLASEEAWEQLRETAEKVVSRPEGRGWLDAQRFACMALENLGHSDAARSVRAVLGAMLRDYPEWPGVELDDGTPCANLETRCWLDDSGLIATSQSPPQGAGMAYVPPASDSAPVTLANSEPSNDGGDVKDPWDLARDMLRKGQPQQAIETITRAIREAPTGRVRFLRTLQQAEFCMMIERPAIAAPLLEDLARQIDAFRLDQWEDVALCTRVFAAYYRCLRLGNDERAGAIYKRLCQLDIGQAMLYGDEPSP